MTDGNLSWEDLRYEGSPFFVSGVNQAVLDRILKAKPSGLLADWFMCKELPRVLTAHRITSFPHHMMDELEEKFGTSLEDTEAYHFGLLTTPVLADACFTWIGMGEEKAKDLFRSLPAPSESYGRFNSYLYAHLPFCTQMLRETKDVRMIFEHSRRVPFDPSVYYRAGVEACEEAFIEHAVALAAEEMRRSGEF